MIDGIDERLASLEKRFAALERRPEGERRLNLLFATALVWGDPAQATAVAAVAPDGAVFVQLAASSTPRMAFGIAANGAPNLWLGDARVAKKKIDIQLALNECPRIALSDDAGRVRAEVTVDPRGAPTIALLDSASNAVGAMLARFSGEPSIHIGRGDE